MKWFDVKSYWKICIRLYINKILLLVLEVCSTMAYGAIPLESNWTYVIKEKSEGEHHLHSFLQHILEWQKFNYSIMCGDCVVWICICMTHVRTCLSLSLISYYVCTVFDNYKYKFLIFPNSFRGVCRLLVFYYFSVSFV